MCVLSGGEKEQTPGASVSGLRPWRQGLTALTEVATNAAFQTALACAHTRSLARCRREEQRKTGRGRKRREEVRCIFGKPLNSGRSCHCFSAFSDQDVFICTDQNRAEVI